MANDDLRISEQKGALTLQGALFDHEGEGKEPRWQVRRLEPGRVLLHRAEDKGAMGPGDDGVTAVTTEVFADLVFGLMQGSWSGVVSVDTGRGIKKIFLEDGEIVFASSSMMDDRLGEVIYRAGMITLDALTDSAVKVDRNTKFGQVLLANRTFSNVDLWEALKIQVLEILRSVFLVDHVYLHLQRGRGLAPTQVIFQDGSRQIIEEYFGYGAMFREFKARLTPQSRAVMRQPVSSAHEFRAGTFTADFLEVIQQEDSIESLLAASKLTDLYTIATLLQFVNLGVCTIEPAIGPEKIAKAPALAALRGKIDAYSMLLQAVKKGFQTLNRPLPTEDLQRFALRQNARGCPTIFVDADGQIGSECVFGIFSQCRANTRMVSSFTVRLESLIQFLLQIAGDMLPRNVSGAIRQDYRNMGL